MHLEQAHGLALPYSIESNVCVREKISGVKPSDVGMCV